MNFFQRASSRVVGMFLLMLMLSTSGCETSGQTGALAGAGIGALAGQAIGGDTGATLAGAAIGSGIGYMIGNEDDKKKARTMESGQTRTVYPTHTEVSPLGGTRWMLVSLAPSDYASPYTSMIFEFRPYGRVITTTTRPDGHVEIFDERYRVVGSTLIVNKPGYIINARYRIDRDEMIVSADEFRAVLRRIQ